MLASKQRVLQPVLYSESKVKVEWDSMIGQLVDLSGESK